jgi:ferredoxin--NADP+ reductase
MGTQLSVAIVGSGPSGAFCARLLAEHPSLDARVDVYERLPAPYGLVRYGVAPDHQRIKSITASFAKVFEDPRVRFIGNIEVGKDVSLGMLRGSYDAVILACGASVGRRLGVPGEELGGVLSATDFVSWYSGHPDAEAERLDRLAATARQVVVIGAGNVALDVARMLVRTPQELRRTDVPEHVVEALAANPDREVTVVGRRGPGFAKFTSKEIAELAVLPAADVFVDEGDLELDQEQERAVGASPAAQRLLSRLRDLAGRPARGHPRSIRFVFGCRPAEILGAETAEAARFHRSHGQATRTIDIPAQLVLSSIGYRGRGLPGIPFDESTGTVPNLAGRVLSCSGPVPGLYAAGWIKRGPSGVIGTNQADAGETVRALVDDVERAAISAGTRADGDLVARLRTVAVGWPGWRAIDQAEEAYGARLGRDRVKLHDRTGLLAAARTGNGGSAG